MQFIFDHLIAILVGATLLGALLVMQQRGQQSSIETVTRHRAETQTSSFLATLSRDIENARTSKQIATGLGTWSKDGISTKTGRAFGIHGSGTRTDRIELVTLANPTSGDDSNLIAVAYEAVELADSVTVGDDRMPLFRVDRYVFEPGAAAWEKRGGSAPNLTSFAIRATTPDGTTLTNGRSDQVPSIVAVELAAAEGALARTSAEQLATTRSHATRQAITVRVVNASSTGSVSSPLAAADLDEIPVFPGVAAYVPPTSTGPGGTGTGDDDPDDGGTGSNPSSTPDPEFPDAPDLDE